MIKTAGFYNLILEAGEHVMSEMSHGKAPWEVYPRPQMRREKYKLLNEGWTIDGKPINVPFPPQSKLSGFEEEVGEHLTYETTFAVPKDFEKERILLNFGAVDQLAEVWLNGELVGTHKGGYLPFAFDITQQVKREGSNQLVVKATDKLDKNLPYGKQTKKRGGMWYTPISGIWQSVWLENVPDEYIVSMRITPDLEGVDIVLEMSTGTLHCERIEPVEKHLWTCEDPYLYTAKLTASEDEVEVYYALRTVEVKEIAGVKRVCLNGNPIFLHGVLDQGYYCDGLFLPPEAEEYERDILRMKDLGFNTLRKHIKVEPEWFYYYCDKHGMLVLQDMVNSGGYSFLKDTALPTIGFKKKNDKTCIYGERKEFFVEHTHDTVNQLYNHPCIVAWTIFNEGWGQFESDYLYEMIKELDSTRLVDSASGWFSAEKSDFDSEHVYFKVKKMSVGERPLLMSECGGYALKIKDHHYSKSTYGYGAVDTCEELTDKISAMYDGMIIPGIQSGICGCIYTQLSDIEDEINGLYTYDRKVCKVDKEKMLEVSRKVKIDQ